jgi:hypothetical protein
MTPNLGSIIMYPLALQITCSHFIAIGLSEMVQSNEMVQGPCAHMELHDRIYVDFTDLLLTGY